MEIWLYTLSRGSASQDKCDIRGLIGLVKMCGVPCAALAVSLLQKHQLNSFHEDNSETGASIIIIRKAESWSMYGGRVNEDRANRSPGGRSESAEKQGGQF
jgi:hypothetical protein